MRAAAVIVAAGQGTRAGIDLVPKQYQPIDGQPMLRHSIEAFARHDEIVAIQVVIHPEHLAAYVAATGHCGAKLLPPVTGGTERQSSGLAGLEALQPHGIDVVLIHDAARPFVSAGIIERVLGDLKSRPASIAAVPLADTLKRQGADGSIAGTVARDGLWRAQTPQGFDFAAILAAHRKAKAAGQTSFTDDASLAEWSGLSVGLVAGSESNRKMTTAEDMRAAQTAAASWPDFRSASGFDVHRFCAGDHVMLCGVRIPHDRGLEGHSDADAPLHALTDALLGCIGAGDIGLHFPPSDQRWKGASSDIFLAEAARLIRVRGGRVGNADVTILSESPRIGPYREAMRTRIAQLLNIAPDKASVKATTMEQLGSIGRSEGLAAMATATVILPPASTTAVDGKA